MERQSRKNRQLALLGIAHSLNHSLFVIAPPLLGLIMTDLNVSKSEIGLVTTIASFIYGAGSLIGGPLGDRIGEAKTIIICLALSGLSSFIMIAAGSTQMVFVYTLALTLMAIWTGLYHPTANALISKTFKGKVSESMGLHGVGGTLGVVLTPTIAWFIGATYGWSWTFVVFGALCTILAFIFPRVFAREEKKDKESVSIANVLRNRDLWVLLVFNVAVGLFMKGVELFFPTFLKENRGIDPMWASVAYTLLLASGAPAQWIGGKSAGRFGSKKVLIAASAAICLSLISLLFFPIHIIGISLFIVLYGLAFYAHQPALNSLTGFLTPQNQRGLVYGVFFFTSFGIGSVSQVITGYVGDSYGLDAAFYILTGFALCALMLSFMLPDKREERLEREITASVYKSINKGDCSSSESRFLRGPRSS
jgi:predicted MFS family arabinose efflux permease